jgi:hypothetical protein
MNLLKPYVIFLFFSFFLFGCSKPNLQSSDEHLLTQKGEKALVFIRIKEFKDWIDNWGPIVFMWRDFNSGGEYKYDRGYLEFSEEASKEGWIYWMLEPGIYYISITFNNNIYREKNPLFSLNVPDNKPVIYAGTLDFEHPVENEENLARAFALQAIDTQTFHLELLSPHKSKTLIFRTPKSRVKELMDG